MKSIASRPAARPGAILARKPRGTTRTGGISGPPAPAGRRRRAREGDRPIDLEGKSWRGGERAVETRGPGRGTAIRRDRGEADRDRRSPATRQQDSAGRPRGNARFRADLALPWRKLEVIMKKRPTISRHGHLGQQRLVLGGFSAIRTNRSHFGPTGGTRARLTTTVNLSGPTRSRSAVDGSSSRESDLPGRLAPPR
jgi:hypothetical protein